MIEKKMSRKEILAHLKSGGTFGRSGRPRKALVVANPYAKETSSHANIWVPKSHLVDANRQVKYLATFHRVEVTIVTETPKGTGASLLIRVKGPLKGVGAFVASITLWARGYSV